MSAPADFSVPTKVLSIDHTFRFFFHFFLLLLIIVIMSLFRKGIKMKIFTFYNYLPKN